VQAVFYYYSAVRVALLDDDVEQLVESVLEGYYLLDVGVSFRQLK
jgi:hypothetical protein